MKVLSLVGARPQFIKEAVIHQEFQKAGIQEIIVNSGQHYDVNMADVFFQVLKIKNPDYDMNIGSGKHGEMTGKILIEFEKILEKEHPDLVLVYGDTNTTLAGAIAASKMKIPLTHVEAGIRQEPKDMPEEINRVLTDRISDLLFCPSRLACENLRKEAIVKNVFFAGDVMYDLFVQMTPLFKDDLLKAHKLQKDHYIVLTLHRDFNVDVRSVFEPILSEVSRIAEKMPVIFPVHPRTRKRIADFGLEKYLKNVIRIDPADYLELMGLVKNSFKVVTDSGGLQKEAYFAGKQAVIVMPDTGWRELVEHQANILADGSNLFEKTFSQSRQEVIPGIYGNGDAGAVIAREIVKFLK